ncbi:MAG: hypothetical protein HC840_30140 [Leptolyngbyaceae cyanobacterium RM2_2_4]|nr:hypothetical protein [Leptolyngbyaceae cyanobacterium RM2_2_4]
MGTLAIASTMLHPTVYSLSRKYGPPEIDLRKAEIMDSYGDETYAARPINHRVTEDVSRDDFDYYQWVFAFMGFKDLLFYLYPIALEYERDKCLNCVDSFMYSLNRFMPEELAQLSAEDQQGVLDGLRWIWDAAPLGYADWVQCPNLQAAIGKSVTW